MRPTQITFLVLLLSTGDSLGGRSRGSTDQANPPSRTIGKIHLQVCNLPGYSPDALCGKYEVFENRDAKSGGAIALNIVVLPALAQKAAPDPVFYLLGGPGMAASLMALVPGEHLAALRRKRDLVFLDQRGTGASNPLQCDLTGDSADVQNFFDEMFPVAKIRSCREKLEKIADLRLYTTPVAMGDLDQVREAFGYPKINLYGWSYGTRSALEYLRQHSGHVRSMVLAGVVSPEFILPLSFVHGAQLAMDKLMEDCKVDKSCNRAFPDLKGDFAAVLAQFDKGSVSFTIENPVSKLRQGVTMSRGMLVEHLRLMLYGVSSASFVPLFIHYAAQKNWEPFGTAVAKNESAPGNLLAMGMYFTVTCSESVPRITESEIARETKDAFMGDYRIRTHLRACMEWPRGDMPPGYYEPVEADVPVLMFSGELDAATPAQFGEAAATHLPNGRQVLIRNVSHDYPPGCLLELAADFFAKGSAKALDTSCVNSFRRPPFATELSTPQS
jgi:pimeloyl-ACP methyl ester carboxylesterase